MEKPFKILCIDGGGIKGLFSAQVLAEFESYFETRISEHFDLVCGTSTGGIIALAVAAGIPMQDVVKFYSESGPKIFCSKWRNFLTEWTYTLKQALVKSKYSSTRLRQALESVFGDRKMSTSQNLLCVPAFNVTDFKPRIFKSDYNHLDQDDDKTFVDVALATAAAPTYFPIHEINDVQYVDGGLYANNPILVGLTEAIFKGYWIKPREKRNKDDFDGVQILSISSCEQPSGIYSHFKQKSFFSWSSSLFDAYSEGQSKSIEYFINQLEPHLDFGVEIKRITNEPLSCEQSKIIALDKASKKALGLLKGKGKSAGNNAKTDTMVYNLFNSKKTINITELKKNGKQS